MFNARTPTEGKDKEGALELSDVLLRHCSQKKAAPLICSLSQASFDAGRDDVDVQDIRYDAAPSDSLPSMDANHKTSTGRKTGSEEEAITLEQPQPGHTYIYQELAPRHKPVQHPRQPHTRPAMAEHQSSNQPVSSEGGKSTQGETLSRNPTHEQLEGFSESCAGLLNTPSVASTLLRLWENPKSFR